MMGDSQDVAQGTQDALASATHTAMDAGVGLAVIGLFVLLLLSMGHRR